MPTYTYDEVLKSDVKREYILKPFLPKGGTLLIAAPEKSMKTFLGLQLALAIAAGEKFIDWQPKPEGSRVLYIDQEIGLAETKARMMYMAEVYNNDKVKANFKIHTDNDVALSLDKQWKRGPEYSTEEPTEGLRALMQVLHDHQPELVVIDPLRDSHSSEENSPTEMSKVMKTLRFLKHKYKFTLIIFHHMGRPKEDPRIKQMGRGTNAIDAAASVIGNITVTEADPAKDRGKILTTHWRARGTAPIEDTKWEFWAVPSLPTDEYEPVPVGHELFKKGMGLSIRHVDDGAGSGVGRKNAAKKEEKVVSIKPEDDPTVGLRDVPEEYEEIV